MFSKIKHDSQKKGGGETKTMYTIKAAPTTINNKQQISRVYSVYRFIIHNY